MHETFFIRSPAGVPWFFSDRDGMLVGEAPGMCAYVDDLGVGAYLVEVFPVHGELVDSSCRRGIAKSVAFALETGDRRACASAQNLTDLEPISADGPSRTVSFSQVREFSGVAKP